MKQMDNMLFQQSQTMDEIKNRLNYIESGHFAESGAGSSAGSIAGSSAGAGSYAPQLDLEQIKHELVDDSEFVSGIVDNIMTNSNLSEIIEQIDTVQTENRELQELLYAQQKTINEMNVMLLKMIGQSLNQPVQAQAATHVVPSASATALPMPMPMPTSPDDNAEADDNAVADTDAVDANGNIQLVVIDAGSNMQSVD